MGFPNDLVLEKGTLHEEFICGICLSLVEYPTYTSCSHGISSDHLYIAFSVSNCKRFSLIRRVPGPCAYHLSKPTLTRRPT
eukprot:1099861-Amorphochlora_amoeboformis.AAC.2